jgi:capsular exopolysaccharide synthesis family protein
LLILALSVLAVAAAEIVTRSATKKFVSSADLQIQALPAYGGDPFQGFDVFRQSVDGSSPTIAAARVFGSPGYSNPVYRRYSARRQSVSLSVTPLSQADIVSVGATASNGSLAASAANAYAATIIAQRKALFQRELVQRMRQISIQMAAVPQRARAASVTYGSLASQLGTLRSWVGSADPTIRILTAATVPSAPSWPRPKLTLILALVLGLLLGSAAAVTLELVNPRFTSEEELLLSHRLPVLARIPRMPARMANEYLLGRATLPPTIWRNYRTLRAVLSGAGADGGYPRSILVSSASPGDGKTMTAVNIAIALADADLRVTLIDADFHRPMIGTIFSIPNRADGVASLLVDPDATKVGAVTAPRYPKLQLLLSTRRPVHQPHLFATDRFQRLLTRLEQESDVIVIDAPPIPEVAEVLDIANAAEAVVLCARIGHTRRDRLGELRDLLARRGVTPLGFVVTSRKRPDASASEYEYATGMEGAIRRSEALQLDR